jgi:hypothetical protein
VKREHIAIQYCTASENVQIVTQYVMGKKQDTYSFEYRHSAASENVQIVTQYVACKKQDTYSSEYTIITLMCLTVAEMFLVFLNDKAHFAN